jgi:hypothetical protein
MLVLLQYWVFSCEIEVEQDLLEINFLLILSELAFRTAMCNKDLIFELAKIFVRWFAQNKSAIVAERIWTATNLRSLRLVGHKSNK